jgi:choline dehydrogenase-like flavoprotein
MIEDLRTAPDDQLLEADVCIVGAGPAGVALALALSGSGLQTILLESGGLSIEAPSQKLNIAENLGLPHGGAIGGRARVLGGAGRLWAGQCVRFDAIDFERRPWVRQSGWPITLESLEPFYQAAEHFFRVENQPTDASFYNLFGQKIPDWSADSIHSMCTVITPEIDVGRYHRGGLKQAADVRVVLHANVVNINTEGEKACGLNLRTLEGRNAEARARAYVLCGGGIENPRLLLASDKQRPAGLGNAQDLVGRFFQEHPNGLTATVDGGDPASLQRQFRMLYGKYKFFPKFRLSESAQRAHEVLNANAHLRFRGAAEEGVTAAKAVVKALRQRKVPSDVPRAFLSLLRGSKEIAQLALSRVYTGMDAPTPLEIRLQCYLEQSPNPDSRIRLGRDVDAVGVRRAAVDWRMSDIERRTALVMTELVAGEFSRLGLGTIVPDAWLYDEKGDWKSRLTDCYHHAGTTRMAEHASQGVVDPTLEVFDVAGLYICGSSVFPTSGYANPNLTIVALAYRLADHLRQRLCDRH